MLAQRLADRIALGCEECVGHAAADHDDVGQAGKIAEQFELGRNLGAADDGDQRALRFFQGGFKRPEFGLHGAAGIGRNQMRRCPRSMNGRDGRRRRRH